MIDGRTPEEREAVLKRLDAAQAAYLATPKEERYTMRHPEKYAFPIGLDDDGKPFPLPPSP